MSVVCNCSTGGGNTGTPTCYGVFDVTVQAILTEYLKSDGSINGIDISTLASGGTILDQAYLDERVKDINPKTRWYPTPSLKNVVDERSDDITEEFEDSTSVFIQEGARAFEGLIIKGDPVLLGNLQSWKCSTAGVFFIDKSGNLIGDGSRAGFLDPILIQDDSFSAGLIKGTDTAKQKNSVKFIIDSLMSDANLRMIEAVSITASLKGVRGLVGVLSAGVTGVTTAGFTVQLNTQYGGLTTPIAAEGMEVSDFSANEISPTPGVEAIATVTESSITPGKYAFVWGSAVASGDVHQVSNPASGPLDKNFDLVPFTVTTP